MKQGGRYAKASEGFTIVETMIVLAVSAGLFVIATLYVGGKQAKTEFQVGVRDIQTEIQQIINQTASGYYGVKDTTCSAGPSGDVTFSAGTTKLGTNGECIFIGKAIVVDSTKLYVYPLAGARQVAGIETTDPVGARATIAGSPEIVTLPNGITLTGAAYDSASLVPHAYGFAILSSMANMIDSATGSQTFDLYGFQGNFLSPDDYEDVINAEKDVSPATSAYLSKKSVRFCMKSAGGDQSALLTIGGESGLAVRHEIMMGASC